MKQRATAECQSVCEETEPRRSVMDWFRRTGAGVWECLAFSITWKDSNFISLWSSECVCVYQWATQLPVQTLHWNSKGPLQTVSCTLLFLYDLSETLYYSLAFPAGFYFIVMCLILYSRLLGAHSGPELFNSAGCKMERKMGTFISHVSFMLIMTIWRISVS